jgi:hypothetical protein
MPLAGGVRHVSPGDLRYQQRRGLGREQLLRLRAVRVAVLARAVMSPAGG